jgi:hypothetical protein
MSRIELYHAALGNEPEKLADNPVFEILQQPAPLSFERLWRRDINELSRVAAKLFSS